MNGEQKVHFKISGAGILKAVGNGDGGSSDLYVGDRTWLGVINPKLGFKSLYQGNAVP